MLLKPGTARLWRLLSSGKIVWAVVKFQRWHFMVQNLKLFSAYKAGYKLKHTISTEQNSSLLTKGRKNGTVCMTKSPKISLYLLRNFTFIMHSFCLQGDRRWGGSLIWKYEQMSLFWILKSPLGSLQVLPEKENLIFFFLVGEFSSSMIDQKLMLNPLKI